MDAVAYIRVSTNKEEQELSLENQREFFEKYVGNRNDTLIRIYSDKGKSATKMKNRKDLQRLLSAARRGEFQRLYVKDISRLFRNTLDFITVSRELANLGVQLHLVNMGEGKDIDMFTLNLMAMIAENESQKISERASNSAKSEVLFRILFSATTEPTNTLLYPIQKKAVGYRKFLTYTPKKNGAWRKLQNFFTSHTSRQKN